MRETRSSHVFRWVTIVILTLFTVVPLYVMVTSSVKPLSEVQSAFTWWP
jgi:multiple sugar transport system permease protein